MIKSNGWHKTSICEHFMEICVWFCVKQCKFAHTVWIIGLIEIRYRNELIKGNPQLEHCLRNGLQFLLSALCNFVSTCFWLAFDAYPFSLSIIVMIITLHSIWKVPHGNELETKWLEKWFCCTHWQSDYWTRQTR